MTSRFDFVRVTVVLEHELREGDARTLALDVVARMLAMAAMAASGTMRRWPR